MEIQVKVILPDAAADLDSAIVSRDVLEQVVAEGYKNARLSLKQVRLLLGFSSRFEAEDFIHPHKAGYSVDDLRDDLQTLDDLGLR